jgi:apolipoprotein N-acyltransferase
MNNLSKPQRYALGILSGILMTLSFPFTGSLTILAFFAWIPLLLIESNISKMKYRSGKVFIHAYITFFIYNLGTTWWIWNASPGGAMMAFVLNALLMAIAFYFFHFIKSKIGEKTGWILFPIVWIGFEYMHYQWELSWPWLSFGNIFSIHPTWIQWYEFTGSLGGTLWILLTNYLATSIIINFISKKRSFKKQIKEITQVLLLIIIPILLSLFLYSNYTEKAKPIEVVILQPNIDPYNVKFTASLDEQLNTMYDMIDKVITPKTEIIIAPETAISWSFYENDLTLLPFYQTLKTRKKNWNNASLLIGASTLSIYDQKKSRASRKLEDGPGYIESYNSSLLIDAQNNNSFIHKSKLVLGVEKLPFSDWFPFLEELSIENGGTSGTLGIEQEPRILETQKFKFAPLICYESIYGEFNAEQCKKGAEAIFVITNDGWWGDTPGYKQHMSFSRIRAIENRRSLARSANTGTSCIIDQRGDVIQKTAYWKQATLK